MNTFYSPSTNQFVSKFDFAKGELEFTCSPNEALPMVAEQSRQLYKECQSRNQSSRAWLHGCPTDWKYISIDKDGNIGEYA